MPIPVALGCWHLGCRPLVPTLQQLHSVCRAGSALAQPQASGTKGSPVMPVMGHITECV